MFRWLFLRFVQLTLFLLFKLRYKIIVKNKKIIDDPKLQKSGLLVLPNHPAETDPFIMLMLLGMKLKLRPLVTEKFFHYPGAGIFMRLLKAKSVADFDRSVSDVKLKQAEDLLKSMTDDLKKGDHFLVYPGAQLKKSGKEKIGGRSLAYNAMQKAPETKMLLVRVTGLWGSLFSTAFTGITPDFWTVIKKACKILLKNGIFFAPRRKVIIEFAEPPKDFPFHGTRKEFNEALEKFYNRYPTEDGQVSEEEPLNLVPYTFWSKKLPSLHQDQESDSDDEDLLVPGNIRQDIIFQLSEMCGKSVKDIKDEDDLVFDVGLDSLNIANLYSYIDDHYEIDSTVEPSDLKKVKDLFKAAMHIKHNKKKGTSEYVSMKSSWPHESRRPEPKHAEGITLIEVFLQKTLEMKKYAAAADQMSGLLDYQRVRLAVVILAKKLQHVEGKHVGVMLPSTTGVYILIFACLLAGKIPVTLNWTVGTYFMNHAIDLMEIKHVITSEKFLERLENVDIGNAISKLLFIEDIRKKISLKDKIKGLFLAKKKTARIMQEFGCAGLNENDTCIVLFTSGTTALPKAVPLSHKNILSNQKAAMKSIDLHHNDVLMMVLPPFHVFGFTLGVLPFLAGIKVAYSPDPLDGNTIARQILKWHATVAIMAPTFFSHLFRSASLSQLKSLRIFISGAEKAPDSLKSFVAKLASGTWFLEGYGLTETSPIISVNFMYEEAKGVGKILPCCQLIIRDPASGRVMGPHEIGEICVTGDSIFSGYYKADNSSVFVEVNGKSYYRTGDLGYTDEGGYLYLEGRIKQTLKRGGEMINLTAIEVNLFQQAKEKKWVKDNVSHTPFACVPKELPSGQSRVVLFTEIDVSLDQVNKALIDAGFSRLYKVNEIIKIDEIPMLKSGKVHYSKLYHLVGNQTNRAF